MIDMSKPIEYHYQRRKWCEAVLISYSFTNFVIKIRMPGTTDCWVQRTVGSISFDKIRNVESTEMFDKDKPIEYKFNDTNWCEAVLLDHDFNGGYLIKYRMGPASMWFHQKVESFETIKIRNVPEKRTYRVVVVKTSDDSIEVFKTNGFYCVGDKYLDGTVVAYHEGEYTE